MNKTQINLSNQL